MRSFPNTVLSRSIVARSATPVQFLRFAFGGGDVRVTTAPFDIDWDGFTWQGIGGFLRLQPVSETPDDRGGQFGLELSGVDQSMISAILGEQYIGRVLEVWWGWVAHATNLLASSGAESALGSMVAAINGATVTRDQTHVQEGDYAVKIAATATDDGASWRADAAGALPSVVPGQSYTWTGWLYAESSVRQVRVAIEWRTGGGSTITFDGATIAVQPGGFQRFSLTATALATAASALPFISSQGGAMNLWADGLQFSPGTDQGLYQPTDGAAIQGGTVIDRPLFVFAGFMNGGFEVQEEMSERDAKSIKIEGKVVSRLASLTVPRGFRTNRESHQRVYRTDQFFEFVPGLANREVVWGSKPFTVGTFVKTGQSPFRRG